MELLTQPFPHQLAAIEKVGRLKAGALFMEQGTGKTRTMLQIIKEKYEKGKINRVLWFCPCSVRSNLREDILYHCGEFPPFIQIVGTEGIAASDRIYINALGYACNGRTMLIVDESALIKNFFAKRTKRILTISEHCPYRYILNGTPISKNEADLFAQWYVIDWRILGYQSYYSFASNHLEFYYVKMPDGREIKTDRVIRVLNVEYLTRKISPYTYQVTKSECLKLPQKLYLEQKFSMTEEQEKIYEKTKEDFLFNIEDFDSTTVYKFFTALQHVSCGMRVTTDPDERMQTERIFDSIYKNPRMKALQKVLDQIGSEKVLIFAKFKSEIEDIEQLLEDLGISFVEFTGRINQKQRQENRKKFQTEAQVMIANKRCGAYGLNLQFCHNIIFYDNDFDWATRAQSEDRVHRIGQTEDVQIWDICADSGIDEFIVENLLKKTNMVEALKSQIHKWKDLKGEKLEKMLSDTSKMAQNEG